MFDVKVYQSMFEALYTVLRNNSASLGREFCEGFMFDYDPNNGQSSQQNAQHLYQYVSDQAQRLNGNASLREDQLFAVIGNFVENIFNIYRQRGTVGQGGGFSNFQQRGPSLGFGNNGGFSGGRTMFGGNGNGGFNQPRPTPGSHLADDSIVGVTRQATTPPASSSMSFAPMKVEESAVKYSANPLDDLPNTGVEFSAVPTKANWGEEKAKDRRIVVTKRDDMKTRDNRFTVQRIGAFHQLIMNDPLQIVKDFFEVVPDSTLGVPFMARISYNHLSVIDVPTNDFQEIRVKCIEAISRDPNAVLHKTIKGILDTMQRGPWKSMTTYLVGHINRALHLASRLSSKPNIFIKINEFEDLDELLSSSFQHPFTAQPEGRYQLEQIVGSTLWNVLVQNTSAMFTDNALYTHAIQSSPAFPYSMEGVYPNKYSIPTQLEAAAETFLKNINAQELSKKTYLLSRRSVTVTNILGKSVLSNIVKDPSVINTPIADLLNSLVIPFNRPEGSRKQNIFDVTPYASEVYPSDQLEVYYNSPSESENNEDTMFGRIPPVVFPVDQNIFAIQYGTKPEEYLMSLDVFSTIDNQMGQGQTILAKRFIPTLKTVI